MRDDPATPDPWRIDEATVEDQAEVLALLRGAGLPEAGLRTLRGHLWVAREAGRVVGCVALELPAAGPAALLRSLAVAPGQRARGLGAALVGTVLSQARRLGLTQLFLLTEGAAPWFRRRGFVECARTAAPAAVRALEEFQGACPDHATCMVRSLGAT